MNYFLRISSFIFHPLLMPLFGVILYYTITPKFIELDIIQAKILAVIIITILIPLVVFFLLKNLNFVESIHLINVSERKYPLMIQLLMILLIVKMVFSAYETPELYYFFIGMIFSILTALILVYFKIKISLHIMGISGFTMFLIALSIHFKINLLVIIGFFFFCNGWVGTSRLHLKSHTFPELILGFFIGIIPQFIILPYWL